MTEAEKLEQRLRNEAFSAEWRAVQDATLTPDQEVEVHRQAHLAVFGTEPPVGERPVDFGRMLRAQEFTLSGMSTMEAELQAPPAPAATAWNTGHRGIPTDRPVWAYFFESGSSEDEPVLLLHGVSDNDGEVFTDAGDAWDRRYGTVVCWIDVEERPTLSVAAVDAVAAALIDRSIHWYCGDHIVEDWMHREALRAVVDGHPDAQAIAAAALKTRELKFSRYYG